MRHLTIQPAVCNCKPAFLSGLVSIPAYNILISHNNASMAGETPKEFILQDFATGSQLTFNDEENTISIKDIEEETIKNIGEAIKNIPLPSETPLSEEERKEQEAKQKAADSERAAREALDATISFEEKFWVVCLETSLDGVPSKNKTAFYIVESMLQYDPIRCYERLYYMDYVGLVGKKLEDFFNGPTIKRNLVVLFDHLDEMINLVGVQGNKSSDAESMSKMTPENLVIAAELSVKKWCPGPAYQKYHQKQIEMISTTVKSGTPEHTKWVETVRKFFSGHQDKDKIAHRMFKYAEEMSKIVDKIVTTKQEIPPAEMPEGATEEPQVKSNPLDVWISPVIYSLISLEPQDIKALSKSFKKIYRKTGVN